MIDRSRHALSILAAAVVLAACGAPPATPAPTADALLARERQAMEAYFAGDGTFFESYLGDKFVMREGGVRLGKTEVVTMTNGIKCDVHDGWSLTEPQLSKIDDDTYVLIYKITVDGSCTAEGQTKPVPSPLRAATVSVRRGDGWQAVFHGENLIVDPAAPAPKRDDKAAAPAAPAPAAPAADAATEALMAAERSIWEAWRSHDPAQCDALTAKEIAFVNIFGTQYANKTATMENWTSPACDVASFALTDGVATSVSPTVSILTLKGSAKGACGGQDISGHMINGTSVYVKDGEAWKWAFGFNSPS